MVKPIRKSPVRAANEVRKAGKRVEELSDKVIKTISKPFGFDKVF